MSIIFNSTTPTPPAGSSNVTWQTNISGDLSAYIPAPGSGSGINSQTATYAVVAGDNGKAIICSSGIAFTVTLLASPPSAQFTLLVKNDGLGVVTIARNTTTIDGRTTNLVLSQGDAVLIYTDGTNYLTASPRPADVQAFMPGVGINNQVLLYVQLTRQTIFPATAVNSAAVAKIAATGSTTFTFSKNGTPFATVVFAGSGTTGTFTQAADAIFSPGDKLEIDGPATADATLASMGISLQGFRF